MHIQVHAYAAEPYFQVLNNAWFFDELCITAYGVPLVI